jgi:8-oxo-dGTP diphosphatase
VVAAALFNERGEVLIAQRPIGKDQAGRWEFPGGKLASGEDAANALRRELREELAIDVLASEHRVSVDHDDAERSLTLSLREVTDWRGEPEAVEGQTLRWVPLAELATIDILEADRPFIAALQHRGLPPR